MAQAIICDRCGTVFKDRGKSRYTLFDTENGSDPIYKFEFHGKEVGLPMDLCNSCLFQLAAWVDAGNLE